MDAAQAGAFVGAMFGAASLVLCGDVAPLSLDTGEEAEIGAALAACLATLPTPIGETVGLIGPWSKLCSTLGGAILKRMALITAARSAAKIAQAQAAGPRAAAPTVPTAPQPRAETPVDVREPGLIFAPIPVPV